MKKIIVFNIIICFLVSGLFAKTGVSIIETQDIYYAVKTDRQALQKLVENEFSDKDFTVRVDAKRFLEEIQLRLSGLAEGKADSRMTDVDFAVLSGIGSYGDLYLLSVRIIDISTYKVIEGQSIICDKSSFLDKGRKMIRDIKKGLKKSITKGKKDHQNSISRNFTVFKFVEKGNHGYGRALLWVLSSSMLQQENINLIEREGSYFITRERELEMSGLVNRDPLKKYQRMYQVDYAIDGLVISEFKGIISVSAKVVDVNTSKVLFPVYAEISEFEDFKYLAEILVNKIEKRFDNFCKFEIVTEPKSAFIYIDKEYIGRSDVIVTEVEKGKHEIQISKPDYITVKLSRTALQWQTVQIHQKLKRQKKEFFKLGLKAEKAKRWQTALDNYKKFINLYSNTANTLDAIYKIGRIYQYGIKKPKQAIVYYNKVLNRFPDAELMAECYYGIGRCNEMMGDFKKAKRIYQMLRKEYKNTSAGIYAITRLEQITVQ